MSYLSFEISQWLGKPIECFRFTCGGNVYLYTSCGKDFVLNNETYKSVPIKRGKFEISQDAIKSDLDINIPRTNDLVALFISQPPEDLLKVTIYRIHRGDTEAVVYWKGRTTSCSITGDEATLKCESLFTSLKRAGLRACYQIPCRHTLYSTQCGVVKSDYSLRLLNVLSPSSCKLSHADLASKADGWWNGGWAELETGEKRMIVAHSGTAVTLNYPFLNISSSGAIVTFYAGCDSLVATCNTKFSNVANFGGFPYIPTDNKFTGDKVM